MSTGEEELHTSAFFLPYMSLYAFEICKQQRISCDSITSCNHTCWIHKLTANTCVKKDEYFSVLNVRLQTLTENTLIHHGRQTSQFFTQNGAVASFPPSQN
jgi:hypothetical protein